MEIICINKRLERIYSHMLLFLATTRSPSYSMCKTEFNQFIRKKQIENLTMW